jgi:hypothetical protein
VKIGHGRDAGHVQDDDAVAARVVRQAGGFDGEFF